MTTTNESRTLLQKALVKDIFKYRNVLAEWGTASGKTNCAIFFLDELLEKNPDSRILLLVGERAHKENWRKEFVKFLGEERTALVYKHLTVECYASLKKYPDTKWTAIVGDEIHHIFSDIRISVFKSMRTDYFLGLSATVSKDNKAELKYILGNLLISNLSLQKSIDNGYIAEPKFLLIPLELSSLPGTETITISRGNKGKRVKLKCSWEERWTYLKNKSRYPNIELEVTCSERQKYDWLNEQFEYSKKTSFMNPGNDRLRNMWLQWGNQRKRFLGSLKTEGAYKLITRLREQNKRILCFCNSIDQANALGSLDAVHSKNSKSSKLITAFNMGKTSELYAVSMLTEGVTLTDVDCEILIQLDGSERLFSQKSGRALRASEPTIYIFYYKNTRDEEFLRKALSQINKEYISIYEFPKKI